MFYKIRSRITVMGIAIFLILSFFEARYNFNSLASLAQENLITSITQNLTALVAICLMVGVSSLLIIYIFHKINIKGILLSVFLGIISPWLMFITFFTRPLFWISLMLFLVIMLISKPIYDLLFCFPIRGGTSDEQ